MKLTAQLAEKGATSEKATIAERDAAIAERDASIKELREQITELTAQLAQKVNDATSEKAPDAMVRLTEWRRAPDESMPTR